MTIYQYCKYIYSVALNNFTSYKNNGKYCAVFKKKKTLQTKDLLIEELKKLIKACIKFVGKKGSLKIKKKVDLINILS